MKKICRICIEEFEIKSKSAHARQFCYNCVPHFDNVGDRTVAKRRAMKKKALSLLGGCCLKCGEVREYCIDFHHIDSDEKEHSIAKLLGDSKIEEYFYELEKTIPLCANCHRDFHFKYGQTSSEENVLEYLELKTIPKYNNSFNRGRTYVEKTLPKPKEKIDYTYLLEEVKQSSFEEVGRKYGVSGNAIKKRLKNAGLPYLMSEIRPTTNEAPKKKEPTWRDLPIKIIKDEEELSFTSGNDAIDYISKVENTNRQRASEGLNRVVTKQRKSYLQYAIDD